MSKPVMRVLPLFTVEAIRAHVIDVLSQHDRLDVRQLELRQANLMRHGQFCGLMFQVSGPRLMRTYAVWSSAEERILFYESTGSRFAETKIVEGATATTVAKAA